LLIIALRTNFLSAAGISWRSTGSDLTVSTAYLDVVLNLWLLSSIILATGALGLREIVEQEKGVLGIRNTGFILIGAALLFAILVGQGLDRLPNESRVLSGLVLDTAIFAFFVLISAYWIVAYVDPNPNLLVMIICLFFLVAVVYRLLARHLDPDLLAASVVALVTIEKSNCPTAESMSFPLTITGHSFWMVPRFSMCHPQRHQRSPPRRWTFSKRPTPSSFVCAITTRP
jgi:hypothetical protein